MLNKYGIGVNHELNTYLKSEHMENTDFATYSDLNPIRPDAFVGFTANMFINPQSIIIMPDNFDNPLNFDNIDDNDNFQNK